MINLHFKDSQFDQLAELNRMEKEMYMLKDVQNAIKLGWLSDDGICYEQKIEKLNKKIKNHRKTLDMSRDM